MVRVSDKIISNTTKVNTQRMPRIPTLPQEQQCVEYSCAFLYPFEEKIDVSSKIFNWRRNFGLNIKYKLNKQFTTVISGSSLRELLGAKIIANLNLKFLFLCTKVSKYKQTHVKQDEYKQ